MSGRFQYGVRLELKLEEKKDESVLYSALAKFPDNSEAGFSLRASYEGKIAEITPCDSQIDVPDWVVQQLDKWALTVFRQASIRNRWPRRLEIWKGAPTGFEPS